MHYRIDITMKFDVDARRLHEAVEMDNGEFISSSASEGSITASAESDSLLSLLRTVDDFISCLQVAERTMKKAAPP